MKNISHTKSRETHKEHKEQNKKINTNRVYPYGAKQTEHYTVQTASDLICVP